MIENITVEVLLTLKEVVVTEQPGDEGTVGGACVCMYVIVFVLVCVCTYIRTYMCGPVQMCCVCGVCMYVRT